MEEKYRINNPMWETDIEKIKNRIDELLLIDDPSICEVLEMDKASSFIKETNDTFLKNNKGKYLSFFSRKISCFKENLSCSTIERFFVMLYEKKTQFSSFLLFFEQYDLSKEMSEESFQHLVFDMQLSIQYFLKSEYWIDKYPNAIKSYFLSKDVNIEILLNTFMKNRNLYYIPKNITKDDFYQLATSYVDNVIEDENGITKPDYNYLSFMIRKIQGLEKYLVVDTILYKKICDQIEYLSEKLMSDEQTKILRTKISIYSDYDQFKKTSDYNVGFVDAEFLIRNSDYSSILTELKYLTGFFTNNGILNLLSFDNIEMDKFDFILSTKSNRHYEESERFNLKQIIIIYELNMFRKILLEEHNILFEEVIEYFFHKYSNDNFNVQWGKLDMTKDPSLKVRTKINFTIEESIRKQWKCLIENGRVDPKIVNFSNTPSFRELGSYLSNKYIYSNSDELEQFFVYLFSNNQLMGYYNDLIFEDNFFDLVVNHEVKYSGFLEYQQKIIDTLLEKNLVSINEDVLYFNDDQKLEGAIYRDIWIYGTINYYNYPDILLREVDKKKFQDKINELLDQEILRGESTLFSIPEMNYLNYLLNNSQYDNSKGLRNKYEHDFIAEDESEYGTDYLYSIVVLLFYIVKINEEFHFKFLLDHKDGLMAEVHSIEDVL